jgi:probable rRNA maturation factor
MTRRAVRSIAIAIEDAKWKTLPAAARARMKKAVLRAMAREKAGGSFTLLLTSDARVKALNGLFRGKDKPTNVLSFPAEENDDRYLGDVAIAYGVVRREARQSGKRFADHLTHLAVHGTLHLLGHDHMKPREAERMEGLEREILAEFGISDPYAPIPAKSRRKAAKRHV